MRSSAGSTKLLKPESLSFLNCMAARVSPAPRQRAPAFCRLASSSDQRSVPRLRPLMKKVGVPVTLSSSDCFSERSAISVRLLKSARHSSCWSRGMPRAAKKSISPRSCASLGKRCFSRQRHGALHQFRVLLHGSDDLRQVLPHLLGQRDIGRRVVAAAREAGDGQVDGVVDLVAQLVADDPAGDVLVLDRLTGLGVEFGAVRAGVAGVFDQLHRRVRIADLVPALGRHRGDVEPAAPVGRRDRGDRFGGLRARRRSCRRRRRRGRRRGGRRGRNVGTWSWQACQLGYG